MIKQQLQDDVKAAMLAGDSARVETLRGLRSAILYAEVAAGKREEGLADGEIQTLFAKEAKKRQESADLYMQGGAPDRAQKELSEKAIIETYLPKQLTEEEVSAIVSEVIATQEAVGMQALGAVIGAVKQRVGSAADGGMIARLVKEKLQ
jgi:hypothetical protein